MSNSFNEVQILSVVVCDDVRRENNGKELLLGVYGSDILASSFPSILTPVFWLQLQPKTKGDIPISFRLMNESGATFFSGSGIMQINSPSELVSMAIGGAPVQAQGEGKLLFQVKIGEEDWRTVREVWIRRSAANQA